MIESLTLQDDGSVIYRKPIITDGVITEYEHCYIAPGEDRPQEVIDALAQSQE